MRLKRELSQFNLLLISIGSIIGSGWLFGSFYTARIAGPSAVLAWLLGGCLIAIIALSVAELSSMFPISGGSTIFVTLSHGKFAGSLFSWITWLWTVVVAPIEVQAILQYASNYIPHIFTPEAHVLSGVGLVYATVLMLIMVAINMIGIKFMAETNNLVVYWKLVIPFSIVIILLFFKPHLSNLTAGGGFLPYGVQGLFSSISTGGVALSFFGFQSAIFLAGETKNPQKSLPLALFGSLFICCVLYTLLQLGFILSINPEALTNGWANMNFLGDSGPFAGIFLALGLPFIIGVLYFDAFISPFGTGLSFVAASSRVLYAMGLQGDAPAVVSKVNRLFVPWAAILVNFIFGMLFFLPFSNWQEMASFISAAIILSLTPGAVCLPIFRKNYSHLERPFILQCHKISAFFIFYLCCLILHWTGWKTVWKLELILAFGCILQVILHMYQNRKMDFDFKTLAWIWIPVHLMSVGVISYLGSYGGKGIIETGPDFIVILCSAAMTYYISQKFTVSKKRSHQLYERILENHTTRNKTVKPT